MLLIFDNDWLDWRKIPDLMPDWLDVNPLQNITTSSAVIGNTGNDIVTLFWGNEFPMVLGVSFLAALFPFVLSSLRLRSCVRMLSAWWNGRVLRCELLDFIF